MADDELPDPASFIAACRQAGVSAAVLAWQDEYAQIPDQGTVDYGRVRRAALLAYQGGRILRCQVTADAGERTRIATQLREAGLTVEERCRNLTRFGS